MKTAVLLASALAFAAPLVPATAMAQEAPLVQVAPTQGQWVQLSDGSWIFVPLNASTYVAAGVPYVYLYTPTYGWNWYASPWGAGAFTYGGAWRTHPWPYGFRYYGGGQHYYGGQQHYAGGQHYYGGGQHYYGGQQHFGGHASGGHPSGGHAGGGHRH